VISLAYVKPKAIQEKRMKRNLFGIVACSIVLVVLAAGPATAQVETRLMRYPDVNKDKVVFDYAGDLWLASTRGGPARRLTSHPGDELFPKFSPDGKWVAFTGEYDGNTDVYVVPAEGGEPRRLTYHPGNDGVLGWTPDSKQVLFRSGRYSYTYRMGQLFLVSVDGGLERMLEIPRGGPASFSPDGKRLAYNPVSREFRTWKRYRGGLAMYIGIYDFDKKGYEELPHGTANDMFPMWHGDSIYFVSDRDGVANLFQYDLKSRKTEKLTNYTEYDVKWPSLGPDSIIYENGGYLYTLDLANNKTAKVPVTVTGDLLDVRPEIKSVAGLIGSYGLSPSGSRALFEARGEIFTLPIKHGSVRNLTDSTGVHELNPAWSPDGQWVGYLSDKSGEYEIYLVPQKGGDEVRVTTDGAVYRYGLKWSPDSKKLLFSDKKNRIYYVDVDEKKPVLIDQTEYGLNSPTDFDWSPDSKWVAYSKGEPNFNNSISIYSIADRKSTRLTDSFYNNFGVAFDGDGKCLYFLSDRFFHPSGTYADNRYNYHNTRGIFAITLQADEPSPFAPRSDEEKGKEEKSGDKEKAAGAGADEAKKDQDKTGDEKAKEGKEEPKPVKVDLEGIQRRVVAVPVEAGTYVSLQARKGKIFYLSIPFEAQQAAAGPPKPRNTLFVFDIKERESKPLLEGINDYDLDADGGKVIYRAGDRFGVVDAVPGKAKVGEGALNTGSLQVRIDPRAEWAQMFHEAWRIERDFYWDPNMRGLDWSAIGKRYEALLPYVSHRSDLNYIIGEMIAELSTSHSYVGGGETPEVKKVNVGLLGADFEIDQGRYRIKKIYKGEDWEPATRSPLDQPGLKVKQGDYLLAVNGENVAGTDNVYAHFENLVGKVVTLKVNDKPSLDGAHEIVVQPIANEGGLRYMDWVESNRRKVAEATGGRIAYIHVPDTSIQGVIMFDKYFSGQFDKEGVIVDERYNSGGNIPDFFTEKLRRPLLNYLAPREGKDIPWPPAAIYGPKVMLINEHAGSGGDAFPYYFKEEKIGPLVGTRTWGGLVGIARQIPMLDGGGVTAPEFAFWTADKNDEWIVENHGVDPDYVVEQRPDLEVRGHDPQLEKAIELVMDQLKKNPPTTPKRPPYPVENHR
jgi:tricorn protease